MTLLFDTSDTRTSVLRSVESLMAYRLRASGFAEGRGGVQTQGFTESTTPTLSRATEVVERNTRVVGNDFPDASEEDEPELRTIAALRSAIELENSVETPNFDRIREWREQLREFVRRVADAGGGDGPTQSALAPVWSFPRPCPPHVEGSEEPVLARRRLRW
jgi:hypothetical protein